MGLVIPLIEESLIPPAKDFFEEDGLALWVCVHNIANSGGKRVYTMPYRSISRLQTRGWYDCFQVCSVYWVKTWTSSQSSSTCSILAS